MFMDNNSKFGKQVKNKEYADSEAFNLNLLSTSVVLSNIEEYGCNPLSGQSLPHK